ncbi:ABC transporter ATP-binding protein [Halocatena pleomorpha]|uniref:ABC transporter ATP-binding protein n=1 Tax=Halocatena pleomorpha TaxID=1785090 RepID=A0A3P3R9I4_9EURY|nr:ABC transporter ATP-binding protein [Halocatena pleomorpha]RRJ30106.1 ABC transporter ATP-binding protein [Halocatena pleomorpha]
MTDDVAIEIRDLAVTFGVDRGESNVVRNVDLDVYREETLGIVGESGSGKSMVALSLLDAVPEPGTVSGEVTYYPEDGDPISVLDLDPEELRRFRWEQVAMVFQGAMTSFNPVMSIRDHFRETLQDHGYDVPAGMERGKEILEQLYLDPDRVLDSHPHELSGGMQQRTLIALSLLLEPEVLLLDEPTAALDLLMQRSIIDLLRGIRETFDLTLVFITHDLPLLTKIADRMAVMYAFDFVEITETDQLLYHSAHPYTRALLSTTPDLTTPPDEIRTIEGNKPDPVEYISGCSYHPRCPMAEEKCHSIEPELMTVETEHEASCHYHAEVPETVPIRNNPRGVADE